jgi:hypothetical protein
MSLGRWSELKQLERSGQSSSGNMPPAAGGDQGGGWQKKKIEKRACM